MAVLTPDREFALQRLPFVPLRAVLFTLLLAFLALVVLYPVALLVYSGFVVEAEDGAKRLGLELWEEAWGLPGLVTSVVNTFNRVAMTTVISLPAGIALAWFAARTDMPGKSFVGTCCWIAFFMPTLPVVLGWILLLDPEYGLLNVLLRDLFGFENGPFDLFTFWGMIFIHLVTKAIAVKYIFLLPAFRNLGAALEESSRVMGASSFYTIVHIVVPVLLPAIAITLVISLIHSLESFEIELILGAPTGFHVFSTKIYQLIQEEPPQFGMATVLGLGILISMLPLIVIQRRIAMRRSHVTLTGGFRGDVLRLRGWRWPTFTAIAVFCLLLTLVPMVFLLIGTFMNLFGFFNIDEPYTLNNWANVLDDSIFFSSLLNTLKLGLGAALIGTVFAAVIAYITVRTKYRFRGAMDFLTWLPASIPGIILGLGMLWMFLTVPLFHPLYGTIGVLILAVALASLTTGAQLIKSNMVQLGFDLEEASSVAGASWLYTFRRIVIPILGHVLLSVGILIFASAARNVANVAMLVTAENRPLAMLQVDYMIDGQYEPAAVIGVVTVIITVGVAAIAVLLGRRAGFRL